MKKLLHKLAHLFGKQHGKAFSFYDGDKLMMSFKCSTCGDMTGVHQVDEVLDRMIYKELTRQHEEKNKDNRRLLNKK